jgi:LPS-assembly protein
MPLPSRIPPTCLSGLTAALLLLSTPAGAQTPPCPPPAAPSAAAADAAPAPTEVRARQARTIRDGISVFSGDVELTRAGQRLTADSLRYDQPRDRIEASGEVQLRTPQGDLYRTDELHLELDTHVGHAGAGTYEIGRVPARGDAARVDFRGRDLTVLTRARYTTCSADRDDWFLTVRELELDTAKDIGTARHAAVRFMGVPVFYFPYLSFPISDERKSGFLVPRVGHTDKSGTEFAAPYYFNLAPNYDATVTPRLLSKRGLQLQNELRYLTPRAGGAVELEVLPGDNVYGDDRAAGRYWHRHAFSPFWSANIDLRGVSDKQYLEDFGDHLGITSQTHLPQNAELNYRGPLLAFTARAAGYQTVDPAIAPDARPYARLPQLLLATGAPASANEINYHFEGEWVNFERDVGVTGTRLNAAPGVSLPLAASWGFLTPRVGARHIGYRLSGTDEERASVTAGVFSLDGGLVFERETRLGERPYTQTLEPRLFYLYVPHRDQDRLPNFDTGVPDLSFASLFRENRLVGGDRIADANQVTAAVTTRFLDDHDGTERLRLSLGRIYYFDDLRVNVPAGTRTPGASDLLAEAAAWFPANVHARAFVQWNRERDEAARASLYLQYQPARDRIVNLGYQLIRGEIEQTDVATEWPLTARLRLRARSLYSLRDDRNLESYAGVVYQTCCWALRVFGSRRFSAPAEQVNAFHLELELTGLGKLGKAPQSPLEQGLFSFPATGAAATP